MTTGKRGWGVPAVLEDMCIIPHPLLADLGHFVPLLTLLPGLGPLDCIDGLEYGVRPRQRLAVGVEDEVGAGLPWLAGCPSLGGGG